MKRFLLLLFLFVMTTGHALWSQVNLDSGLVAYYPFNGNSNDESGFNHHPVFNNASLTTDRFGTPNSAYRFNGIDNYIQIKDSPDLNFADQISLAVWIKPMGFYKGTCHGNSILIKGADIDPDGRYALRFDDAQYYNYNQCSITVPDTAHENYWGAGAVIAGGYEPYVKMNEWVSIVYTCDGRYARLYIDCKLVIDNEIPGLNFTNSYDLFLGKLDAAAFPYWFNGEMDDVRIYNRPLNEEEVFFIASDGKLPHASLQTLFLKPGDTIKLGASNSSPSYNWFPTGEVSDSISVYDEGLYYVETSGGGCTISDSFAVVFVYIDFSFQYNLCDSLNVTFKNETSGVTIIGWDFGDGESRSAGEAVNYVYSKPGKYLVTLSAINGDGIEVKVAKEIEVYRPNQPRVILTPDTVICKGESVQFETIGAKDYKWSPSETLNDPEISNPIATPIGNTTYFLTITDSFNDCLRIDSIRVFVRELNKFNVSGEREICYGESTTVRASGGDLYQWTSESSTDSWNTPDITISPSITSQYSVHITENICGYDSTINVEVRVNPVPIIRAQKSNDIDCLVRDTRLNASGGVRYEWSPSLGLNNHTISNPLASPSVSTVYKVRGENQFGCHGEDSVLVKVTKEGVGLYLIPNAFTPNHDGINDCLNIRSWGVTELEQFSVFNRWGELVFQTTNPNDCWDGTYKGKDQPAGTFVYVIRAKTLCGDINKKGFITLIR